MARPREFDIDTAVSAAMDVFWYRGYASASLPNLLNGTGLSRSSFYKAFEGKQQLFWTVMPRKKSGQPPHCYMATAP